ncbi:VOC family protein [Kibdelosporangium phytohabitans]|uniref:Glyoxalase n=1 Tax=Kibdelosporangium phytohabitans TaxID=860235 RepID=A0A0N9I2I4_9PSEU|nr:VOC family protein [Kibdelosporangium phytohabitans]ALG12835.1 glyoxalase [Kibdelosporangium phytohabitans]MBE1464527.1 putative glyoxalase superfamily protein PhnB [Kibdelosporangium phytohabitans]
MTSDNNPGVWPTLIFSDAEAARVFMTEVLGFTETLTVRDDNDSTRIVHAELKWPEGGGLMYGSGGNHPDYPQPVPGTQWVYVCTADIDGVHRRVADAGGKVVTEPYETDYGARNVAIADPEGNVWTFGTYPGA